MNFRVMLELFLVFMVLLICSCLLVWSVWVVVLLVFDSVILLCMDSIWVGVGLVCS